MIKSDISRKMNEVKESGGKDDLGAISWKEA